MAFDEVQFPLRVRYGAAGGPEFRTEIALLQNGREQRNQVWSQARRRYDARTGVTSVADAALLMAFFQARKGRARGFRLRDWMEFSSAADGLALPDRADQTIGTGDGVQTQFALRKTYGSGESATVRPVTKPVEDSVRIGVDGTEYETGWSIDCASGIVTFAQAPAEGAAIRAGFLFDVPVRFDTDRLSLRMPHGQLAASEEDIPLIELVTP